MATLSPTSTNLSSTSTSTSSPHPQRPPPPSLFLGPPSRNASNISLPSTAQPTSTPQPGPPNLRTRTQTRAPDPTPLGRSPRPPLSQTQTEGDRTDALWAEMQATLAEVELSAFGSTHVFGPAHSAALEELREAQIALAQAWGRSEADEDEELKRNKDEIREDEKKGGVGLEEDGEEGDILMARRRREANERYFRKVGEEVNDVVGKLDGVAAAMAKAERESREIWGGSESLGTGTEAGTGSVAS